MKYVNLWIPLQTYQKVGRQTPIKIPFCIFEAKSISLWCTGKPIPHINLPVEQVYKHLVGGKENFQSLWTFVSRKLMQINHGFPWRKYFLFPCHPVISYQIFPLFQGFSKLMMDSDLYGFIVVVCGVLLLLFCVWFCLFSAAVTYKSSCIAGVKFLV